MEAVTSLTKSQNVAHEKINKFLNGPDQFFLLKGKPGVGKTFILKTVLADYIEQDLKNQGGRHNINVAGITLAHKAKGVLRNSIPNVWTFASAFNMKEDIKDDGSVSFSRKPSKPDQFIPGTAGLPIYVFDECSMFNQQMLNIIYETMTSFSKIIFVGDEAQLPPIFTPQELLTRNPDDDSPIFDLDWNETNSHTLTERVRQAEGNPILELSDIIREEIFAEQNINKVLEHMKKPKMFQGQGYTFIKREHVVQDYIENCANDLVNTKIICYHRKNVELYNTEIRSQIVPQAESFVMEGDSIFITKNYFPEMRKERKDLQFAKVKNSDEFIVKHVFKDIYNFNIHNLGLIGIECYVVRLCEFTGFLLVPTEHGQVNYMKAHKQLVNNANKASHLKKSFVWKKLHMFNSNFCPFNYGYSITSHKSQGSTYRTVYVDINDILSNRRTSNKRKLQAIYTAMTRASHAVKFIKRNAK